MKWKETFEFAHKNLDGWTIKEKVDRHGIDWYINYCAGLAATTGAAAGIGGGVTLALGIPADVANTVAQQFRVTLAVIYSKTGKYSVGFDQFMKIVGISIGVEAGLVAMNILVNRVGQELLKRLAARSAARFVPLLGAVAGGGLNFAFIQGIGRSLKAMEDSIFE